MENKNHICDGNDVQEQPMMSSKTNNVTQQQQQQQRNEIVVPSTEWININDIRSNVKFIRSILQYWFTVARKTTTTKTSRTTTTTSVDGKAKTSTTTTKNTSSSKDNTKFDIDESNNDIDYHVIDDVSILQKQLWMISNQNTALRTMVDAYIVQQFGYLLCQLTMDLNTTTSTRDDDGTQTVPESGAATTTTPTSLSVISSSSYNNYSTLWNQWCIVDADVYGWEGKLATIIVLDQFSRHIHRYLATTAVDDTNSDHSRIKYIRQHIPDQMYIDQMAYTTTQLLLKHHTVEFNSTSIISIPMRIFAIMPLRHYHHHKHSIDKVRSIQQTQYMIDTIFTVQHNNHIYPLIQSFRKATNRRYNILQDELRKESNCSTSNIEKSSSTVSDNNVDNATTTSIDLNESTNHDSYDITKHKDEDNNYNEEDILECGHFIPDNIETAPIHHIVYKTICNFLQQHMNIGLSNGSNSSKRINEVSVSSSLSQRRTIIISLSGGVDSMVICAVLSHLQQYNSAYKHIRIVALHIDYANRGESYAESQYVLKYCQDILRNVDFYCRRIDEVTRGITARDDYERIAREIRYKFYRDTIQSYSENNIDEHSIGNNGQQQYGKRLTALDAKKVIGVMLGHHRGDLRENVLSNAHKGCGPLDLSGMTSISTNDGVLLLRPLLSLEKTFIFDYAHAYGVPYFKDTTPHWSTRGKLRNKLLPLLEEIYGEGSMNNLSNLAVESDECRALLHSVLIQPFMDGIVYKPMGIYFPTQRWIKEGLYFWKIILRETLHSAGLGMFSDKSVESFIKRVCCSSTTIQDGWLQCRKDYGVYLRKDGYVFVLYPTSFPWGHASNVKMIIDEWTKNVTGLTSYSRNDEKSNLPITLHVGPWTIVTKNHESLQSDDAQKFINRKVFSTMEEFMDGIYEYWLEAPSEHGGIVHSTTGSKATKNNSRLKFCSFVKSTRPKAWKCIDPKVQDALPLLGFVHDDNAKEASSLPEGLHKSNEPDLIEDDIAIVTTNKVYVQVILSLTSRR